MPDVNSEMKANSDFAIKSARDRFKQELDFSEQSIAKLENILEKIYWGFSGHTDDKGEGGLIYNTAIIWGSYLGEYMRSKWGGNWILKGADRLVSINNVEFSPISLVYQKITSHPEYQVEDYLVEKERIIYKSAINPDHAQTLAKKVVQPKIQPQVEKVKKPVGIDKRLRYVLASVGGIIVVIVACFGGYMLIKASGIPAFGIKVSATSSSTNIPTEIIIASATPALTNTPSPTVTLLPTYTPKPSISPSPSFTPSLTYALASTFTPTSTLTPFIPTYTQVVASRTPIRNTPTDTHVPQTEGPAPTATQAAPPTATEPPPPVILSCEINPSTIQAGYNVNLTFSIHFSAPGYGFDAIVQAKYPGQAGCSGADGNGDGTASCDGSSGMLPEATKVDVTFRSSLGECTASYSSQ